MYVQILNTFSKTFVYEKFEPTNPKHLEAYVCLQQYGRQHPTLRFVIEQPYVDVMSMMKTKIADMYAQSVAGVYMGAVETLGKTSASFQKNFGEHVKQALLISK